MGRAHAQAGTGGVDDPEQLHMVHVTPHLLVFDAHTRTATVTFSNEGNLPVEADVLLQYGVTRWRYQDTALFSPPNHAPDWILDAYDTVIVKPGPQDPYAGTWLAGVPAHFRLEPHQHKVVTLRMTPPPRLPTGEYYVRLVTLSHPGPRKGAKSLDTKLRQVVPVKGQGPPPPRDSVRIYYRQGPQRMGVQIALAHAAIDTTRAAEDYAEAHNLGRNPLRTMIKLHLTGPTHFEGYLDSYYLLPNGQRISLTWKGAVADLVFSVSNDVVMRWLSQTDMLSPGHYTHVVRLIPYMADFPPIWRVPMDTAQVAIPFDVP